MVFGIYGVGGSGRSFMNLALRYNKEVKYKTRKKSK